MKGAVVISETVLSAISIVISFILISFVVYIIFSRQSSSTYEELYSSIARDITTSIDRIVALAGSSKIEQEIPKGVKMNLTIDYKSIFINYGDKTIKRSFSGLIHSGPYNFENPEVLCIVKSRNDRRVTISDRPCRCDVKDDICDPACVVEVLCDPKCYSNEPDNVCNPLCIEDGDGVCDPDCYRNETDMVWDEDCSTANPDGVCDPDSDNMKNGVCDPDCFVIYNEIPGVCDPDCKPEDDGNGVEDEEDGICYAGCYNMTDEYGRLILKHDNICDLDCNKTNDICDPDCTNDEDCIFRCSNIGESCEELPPCPDSGGICCPGTNITSLECCGNGVCENRDMWPPGNSVRWETNYTCPDDCCPPGEDCPTRPVDCEMRVDKGSWTASPCYSSITEPIWVDSVIEVCSEEVQKYLDRRNWDIKEVARSVKSPLPEGWAFDNCRYYISPCSVQTASQTIEANEKFTINYSPFKWCHCEPQPVPSCGNAYPTEECCGVGFCIDHATAMLSILRTLGVPQDHIYATFDHHEESRRVCGRHGFVVYKCDSTLPQELQLEECSGLPDGTWMMIDATGHSIRPLNQNNCINMCIFWNDHGVYPAIPQSEGGGLISQIVGPPSIIRGYTIPIDVPKCKDSTNTVCDESNPPYGIKCEYDKLCGLLASKYGVDQFECVIP